ncbi:DNA-binding transcriptional ArsR family regulator [Pullulanibacillus pueri]|uniref:Transcriptional regulator n=1 Tax=Pullulanibacillus pueri TaxID=1437324 RepID=A0A8J2ZYI4_9BACL|nr:metalloregulator ArsR/SmtB family transcription factor [Pullulanibacillus pueri]MBM7683531.1 DNA-binding transcriptional ArsR family regulator [Pullulanibacillus pueri]GGH86898.1 transcriptional regulator [Pullulanibacillus pueri]
MAPSKEPGNVNEKDFFQALGDNTRRTIIDLLAERGEMTVTQLSEHFPNLVRSGISKHLMQLRKLNLVYSIKRGREHIYRINPEVIRDVLKPWVQKYEKFWDERLLRLKQSAESSKRDHEE